MHRSNHRTAAGLARLLIATSLLFSLFFTAAASARSTPSFSAATRKPALVKDIQTMNGWSMPHEFASPGSVFYFNANDGIHGAELWRSQGTPETTGMVADLVAGLQGSSPFLITPLDATHVIFIADDDASNTYLAVSDGTAGGTRLLTQLVNSSIDISQAPVRLNGVVYLQIGGNLWRTNGTKAGTVQVTSLPLSAGSLAAFDGWLYFAASGPQGKELYRTSPSAPEPELVIDLCPEGIDCGGDLGDADPGSLAAAPDRLYFVASDETHGRAIWSTTGTAESVTLFADLLPVGRGADSYSRLTPVKNGLYFLGDDGVTGKGRELWYSGGTPATTGLLADLTPGPDSGEYNEMVPLGEALFFTARPVFPGAYALYRATTAGIEKLSESLTAAADPVRAGSTVFFEGTTSTNLTELWQVTETGAPQRVTTIIPKHFYTRDSGAWGNRLVFASADPLHGTELWMSDGTEAGTQMVADINTQVQSLGANIPDLTITYLGSVYFQAASGLDYYGLWRSDGTMDGTQPVAQFDSGWAGLSDAAVSHDLLYFTAVTSQGDSGGLWRSDGTEKGTLRINDMHPRRLMDVGGKLFFISEDEANTKTGLWVLNKGDTAPTLIKETGYGGDLQLGALCCKAFLVSWGAEGWELTVTDGTVGGTHTIYGPVGRPAGSTTGYRYNQLEEMTIFDGRLFFVAPLQDGSDAFGLYATDGENVTQVRAAQGEPRFPTQPVIAGDSLYFGGMNGADSVLWRLPIGSSTAQVVHTAAANLDGYQESRIPVPLADLKGKLVFRADPPGDGSLLWLSDGTPAGTAPLCPDCGYQVTSFQRPVTAGSALYFAASDTQSHQGNELWVSDGTSAGTHLFADILPGPGSSDPANLIVFGQQLLFTASDGVDPVSGHGTELWSYRYVLPIKNYLPVVVR